MLDRCIKLSISFNIEKSIRFLECVSKYIITPKRVFRYASEFTKACVGLRRSLSVRLGLEFIVSLCAVPISGKP